MRRLACDKLATAIISENTSKHNTTDSVLDFNKRQSKTATDNADVCDSFSEKKARTCQNTDSTNLFAVSVSTAQQLKVLSDFPDIKKLYVDADILCADTGLYEYATSLKKAYDMQLYFAQALI